MEAPVNGAGHHNKLVLAVAAQALLSTLMRSSRPPYLQYKKVLLLNIHQVWQN